jgi:succinoglycan biosynthesis transport protein ExoP
MAERTLKDEIFDSGKPSRYFGDDDAGIDFTAHLKTVINILRRNALLISGIIAGVVFVGIAITLLMTPTYKATAQILIEDQADQIIEGGDLQKAGASWDTERFLQTQLGIIQSRSLARFIVQSANLDRDPNFFHAFAGAVPTNKDIPGQNLDNTRRDNAIDVLVGALVVNMAPDSRIATITITSRSPDYSAKLANMYAEQYIQYNLNLKYDSSSYARRFLAEQLEETRTKLTQSERDLNQYARAAGLIRVGGQGEAGSQESALSITNNMLVQLNGAAATAMAERIAAEDRWKTLSNQPLLAISEVNSNGVIMQLVGDKAKAEAQLADELSKHLEGYASVKAKKAEIAELDRRITAYGNSLKKSSQVDYQAAFEKEKSLRARVSSLRSEALQEQDRGVQYSVLKRSSDTYRALYESLLSRYNQLNASAGSASNNVTIVDRADVPRNSSSPKFGINILISFLLGLVCAAAAILLKEVLDDAINSPDDVEKKLGLPLLGLIPVSDQGDMRDELSNRKSGASEAYRSLVTNLRYSTSAGLPKVVAITSSRESEGKSTTSRAVAADIANLGKKVLLVDTDLRRPTLHRAMDDNRGSGLTDVLTGQKKFDEVVQQASDAPTLSYMTALPTPPDPALILAGEGLATFIAEAREAFDVIVLDCPPLLGLSDATLLANQADGVLFIIDASSFHRGAVKSALRRLALVNANIIGVVLNRFSPRLNGDDYDYYSYNYYSYGSEKT